MPAGSQVDFSDIIAGRPKEVGLEVLAAVCGGVRDREGLTLVDVSENAMGPDGVQACRPAIEGKEKLQALLMCNDGLSAAAMEAVRVRGVVEERREISKGKEKEGGRRFSGRRVWLVFCCCERFGLFYNGGKR